MGTPFDLSSTLKREDLNALVKKSIERFNSLPPEERAYLKAKQALSFVRGNISLDYPPEDEERLRKISEESDLGLLIGLIDRLRKEVEELKAKVQNETS